YPAIIVSALLFDRGNGIFATLLSGALVAYFLIPPQSAFAPPPSKDAIALMLFMAVGLFMAILVEIFHVTAGKLEDSRTLAEQSAHERAVLLRELTHRMRNHLATIG